MVATCDVDDVALEAALELPAARPAGTVGSRDRAKPKEVCRAIRKHTETPANSEDACPG